MKITVIYSDKHFAKPIAYTFNLMLSVLGIPHEILPYSDYSYNTVSTGNLVISYGCNRANNLNANYNIHIYQSKLFGRYYKLMPSMPQLPLKCWNGLPVIYQGNGDIRGFSEVSQNVIQTNIDIIASSFFMLSRYEEVILDERDEFDRFPARASLAYKEDFLTSSIVNEYIDLLWEWISSFNLGFDRRKLWNGRDFAVCLTHDIDALWKYRWCNEIRILGSLIIKSRQPLAALRRVSYAVPTLFRLKPDPYCNLEHLMNLEQRCSFRSTFYFMSDKGSKFSGRYSIERSEVKELVRQIEGRGHEVGLHGSFHSYNNSKVLANEKKRLDSVVSSKHYGARQHALRWKTPDTWRILEAAGLLYDTTLGFADHEGFRCGFCLPYRPFDVMEDRTLSIWELPLTVMDFTLQQYRNMSLKAAWQSILSLLEVTKKHNGLFVLLWHNSSLDDMALPGWGQLYHRLLCYISSQNVLATSGIQIVAHWQSNREMATQIQRLTQ